MAGALITRRAAGRAMTGAAIAPALLGLGAAARAAPVARTSHGPVRGAWHGAIAVFRGVRYGADTRPVRFQRPRPPAPWREVLNAADFGPAAPQRGGAGDEDCLFLNVWTPSLDRDASRPVMVYVHGGGYATGSGADPQTDGALLAAQGDVVVITLNHRLNAFGYLSLPLVFPERAPDSGNAGQWDMVLALQWVRANARAFGGDPGRVMLFGQSGGGAKIASLMASPAAHGLFHAVATMSGQQVTASGPLNAAKRARRYIAALGLDPDRADSFDALRAMPSARLVEALDTPDAIDPERGGVYFGPVLDGRMLQRHPFWPNAPAQSASIPMILGNTRDETRTLIGRGDPQAFTLGWDELPARLARHMRCDIDPHIVISAYRAHTPDISPSDLFFAATSAARSWRGQVEEADARAAQGAPTWVYRYDLASPQHHGQWGAPHTIDIAAAFGNIGAPGALTGQDETTRKVSAELMSAFVALARTGDPNNSALPAWPRYQLPARATLLLDRQTQVQDDPRSFAREMFATVPFIQWGS